jgi:hypothetical protein
MFKLFDKTNFNEFRFISELEENGFNVHNIGGSHESDFSKGDVYRFNNGQYQLVGKTGAILTCNANVFYKTLIDVEKQFKYNLFG